MSAGLELRLDAAAFERMGRSPEMNAALLEISGRIADAARASAPVDSGDYRAGIKVELRRAAGRNVGRVEFTDPKSVVIESRTGNAYRALRAGRG